MHALQKTRGMRSPRAGRIGQRAALCLLLGAGAVGLAAAAAAPATAQDETAAERPRIYRWIDENGITHYTTDLERIPAALRSRAGGPAREDELRPRAPRGNADLWIARDRAISPDEEAWYEGDGMRAPEPVDPAVAAARREEAAVALFDLDLRIAELEVEIATDEESLKRMISDPNSGGPMASEHNTEFRSIAVRLPKQLSELQALRNERETLGEPGSDDATE
ncbi:MAG: hypothetical protein CL910_12140 [Deltaproteobacteria bacterium]|nr:hypothetical protein [Deltaproteobacteria bacterium]